MLVCLAASIAMIQANLLLSTGGKADDSFTRIYVMRLPLGILTGVGFIGAGTILKRENRVTGVTTASTLWIVTVIGLCFGAGQIVLGIVATVLSVATLSVMKLRDETPQSCGFTSTFAAKRRRMSPRSSAAAFGCRASSTKTGLARGQSYGPSTSSTLEAFRLCPRAPEPIHISRH